MPRRSSILLLVAAFALGGCSTGTLLDDVDTMWGGESRAEEARREAVVQARTIKIPVDSVSGVELGRTRDGFLITAYGTAPGLGYSLPQLRPRRGGQPGLDGYVEYDFVATEPPPGFALPQGTARTRALRADIAVPAGALVGTRGIRVIGQRGGAQLDFAPPEAARQS